MTDDKIGIVGFGYVGLTLGAFLADQGLDVVGVDQDPDLVDTINDGETEIEEEGLPDLVAEHTATGRLRATTNVAALEDRDTILVTVGTPLGDDHRPDQSAVEAVARDLGTVLDEGDLVVLKSTITPGTTRNVVARTIEDETGMVAGEDYHLAFSPERLAEGNALHDLRTIPVIVGAVSEAGAKRTQALFEGVGLETHPVANPEEAEMAKLACNLWIDLNIALANELALLGEHERVDTLRVIEAANTLPKGQHHVNVLYPGSGVGGSCLTKDPWFVHSRARDHGLDLLTPEAGRRANDRMPAHMADLLEEEIGDLQDRRITILGLAFKGGTNDLRNTPAAPLARELRERGATVVGHDPLVTPEAAEAEVGVENERHLEAALEGAHGVAVVTAQDAFHDIDWSKAATHLEDPKAVADGRDLVDPEAAQAAGLALRKVGVDPEVHR